MANAKKFSRFGVLGLVQGQLSLEAHWVMGGSQ